MTQILEIQGASTTSTTIEGLTPGDWYFAVSALTNNGVESDPTNPVWKTI